MSASPVKVGIVGQGRSGWGIHALTLQKMAERYQIVAVCDPLEARRQEAVQTFGCRAYASVPDLLVDSAVELVVVASPSYLHAAHSIAALQAGKAVVCEKPAAVTLADADSMLAAAERAGSLLTFFQCRRFDPSYLKIREVIAAGKLGRIVEIKMTAHGFGRRWDWQTIKGFGGGQLRNNVVHYLDMALQFMGDVEPQVFCRMENALSLGDAEDCVKLILHAPTAPLVDMELSSVCAYPHDLWLVGGTQGTLVGGMSELRWKYYLPHELPAHTLSTEPTPDRSYNTDNITFYEEQWAAGSEMPLSEAYYLDLYRTLREGAPLSVTPGSVRRVMHVIDQCERG